MSELYTSLTQLKMALNGGTMPPMTPLTDEAKKYIDPDLTIGMGALYEDQEKGLRCPVRGCGEFHHWLTRHLDLKHKAIGGAAEIRQSLSIPPSVSLASHSFKSRLKARSTSSYVKRAAPLRPTKSKPGQGRGEVWAEKIRESKASVHTLNKLNACHAQVQKWILDNSPDGISPCHLKKVPSRIRVQILKVYGSWTAAVAAVGLKPTLQGRRYTHDDIYDSMGEWFKRHGRLPTAREAQSPERTPVIPSYNAVISQLGVRGWDDAMSHVGWILGLDQEKTA